MKILLLLLTLALAVTNTNPMIKVEKHISLIFQPSLVDALDPSRPRLA